MVWSRSARHQPTPKFTETDPSRADQDQVSLQKPRSERTRLRLTNPSPPTRRDRVVSKYATCLIIYFLAQFNNKSKKFSLTFEFCHDSDEATRFWNLDVLNRNFAPKKIDFWNLYCKVILRKIFCQFSVSREFGLGLLLYRGLPDQVSSKVDVVVGAEGGRPRPPPAPPPSFETYKGKITLLCGCGTTLFFSRTIRGKNIYLLSKHASNLHVKIFINSKTFVCYFFEKLCEWKLVMYVHSAYQAGEIVKEGGIRVPYPYDFLVIPRGFVSQDFVFAGLRISGLRIPWLRIVMTSYCQNFVSHGFVSRGFVLSGLRIVNTSYFQHFVFSSGNGRFDSDRIESNRKNRSSSRNRIESNESIIGRNRIESNRSSIEVHGTVDSNRFDPKILLCKKSHKFQSPKRSHASCVACIPENGQFDPNWLESNEKIYFRAEKKIESNRIEKIGHQAEIESIESNRTPAWIESNRNFFFLNRIERIESNPSRIESNRIDASGPMTVPWFSWLRILNTSYYYDFGISKFVSQSLLSRKLEYRMFTHIVFWTVVESELLSWFLR